MFVFVLWVGLRLWHLTSTINTFFFSNHNKSNHNSNSSLPQPQQPAQPLLPSPNYITYDHEYVRAHDDNDNNKHDSRSSRSSSSNDLFYHSSLEYHQIPHIVILTHKTNLLDSSAPLSSLSSSSLRLLDNINHTIQLYLSAWQRIDTQLYWKRQEQRNKQQRKHGTQPKQRQRPPKPRVWFLDNTECRRLLERIEPQLVQYWDQESNGSYRGDLCRTAALYASGGYYMDIDMKALDQAILLPTTTTFSSAMTTTIVAPATIPTPGTISLPPSTTTTAMTTLPTATTSNFFNSYWAVAPRHPMTWNVLQLLLQYYRVQDERRQWILEQQQQHEQILEQEASVPSVWNCQARLARDVMVLTYPNQQQQQPAVCIMIEYGLIGCYALKVAYEYHKKKMTEYTNHERNRNHHDNNRYHHNNSTSTFSSTGTTDTTMTEHDKWSTATATASSTTTSTTRTTKSTTIIPRRRRRRAPRPRLPQHAWMRMVLLMEDNYSDPYLQSEYPHSVAWQNHGVGSCCNYLVHSQKSAKPYFLSRIVGAGPSCQLPTTTSMETTTVSPLSTWSASEELQEEQKEEQVQQQYERKLPLVPETMVEYFHLSSPPQSVLKTTT